ncbi:ABC-2 transporter permease [Lysinibacillus sp. KU-BSD001]|uniref:ABC-2 transporter permease n=1 Tax=Lysinibacillus sp. KU-BSD001 TaxID=3141328 RepID=UPI0036F14858
MYALVRLQFELHKKPLLFLIVLLLIISFLFPASNIPIFTYIMAINAITSSTFLSNNAFYRTLHTMPVKRESIVKSSYTFSFLFVSIIFMILALFQVNTGMSYENPQEHWGFFTGFFGSAIVAIALQQYFIFTNEKVMKSSVDHALATFGSLFVIMAPHAAFCLIGPEETFYIRMMIMPIISCAFYVIILKISIRAYKKRELF